MKRVRAVNVVRAVADTGPIRLLCGDRAHATAAVDRSVAVI